MSGIPQLPEILDASRSALVLWDMQKGIGARAHNFGTLRSNQNALIAAARDCGVATYWTLHSGQPVERLSGPALRLLGARQGVIDRVELTAFMQKGTPETQLVDGLAPVGADVVIEKLTPSLFVGTPVEILLRAAGIETLVLSGVATEMGIEFTARHADALGFHVVVAEDAVGSYTEAGHELGLNYLRSAVTVLSSTEIVRYWTESGNG